MLCLSACPGDFTDLCSFRRTENDGRHVLVLDTPRQAELRDIATKLLRNLSKLPHLGNLRLALLGLQLLDGALEEALVVRKTRVLWDAVVVFASEQARSKWGPDRGAVLELIEQRRVLNLEALAVEGVVLRLLGNGRNEVVLLGDLGRLHNLDGGPLGRAPVVGEVEVANALGEALDDLLHRGADVGPVGEHDVDVRLLQTSEGALETLNNVLAGETTGVGLLAAWRELSAFMGYSQG